MLELLAAGAALAGCALLQAADTALLAVGEDDIRGLEQDHGRRVRWLLKLKKEPETTAAALRGVSSALLAFAAVACAIWVGEILRRAGVHANSRSTLQLLAGLLAGAVALVIDLAPRSLASARPLGWALALAGPTYLVCLVLRPAVRLMLKIFDALLVRGGATARNRHHSAQRGQQSLQRRWRYERNHSRLRSLNRFAIHLGLQQIRYQFERR